ncbi:bifunctional DedA family/phosphatase PAP2 family protein [Geobacter pickeringii]|uniref:Phosphatidic acid phosphatase type 2/haloperoxidase domain-containing protein n=1 Tax=Geobacter pickeringii TaxID=345632 RepID=A0A0B5BHX8_9BACT|nr:bifunctional DedA family/phosphatase PAP2 family protein [Geobacter pickeringii]AJE04085.1 hypothetical protein GPICK_12595 [Geobacter pickeringii]
MELIDSLIPKLEHFRMLGYWIVFLVSLLESLAFVGLVVPGAVFVIFAGSLAAKGYFDLGDLIWFATMGAILGDGISFRLGTGNPIPFREENRLFKPSYLERGKEFFARHGGASIVIGRFNGLIRAVVPFVAGLAGMRPGRFFLWNAAGAVAWATTHLVAGYLLGEAWRSVEVWATRFEAVLAAVLLFALGGYLTKRFFEKGGKQLLALAGSASRSLSGAISASSFAVNHPSLMAFLRGRFDRTRFSGRPLTLLGLSFLYVILLLGGVIEDLLTADPLVAADTRIENLLNALRDPLMVKIFLWVTHLGRAPMVVAVALTLCAILVLWRRGTFIVPFLVALAGACATAGFGKVVFHRPRPAGVAVYPEWTYSFPSGHAVIATALYGFVVYLLCRHTERWGRRLNILFAGLFLMAAIGFSRLYLGVHFLSDVLGGYLVGLLWLIIGISLAEWRRAGGHSATMPVTATRRAAGAFLLVVLASFSIWSGARYHPSRVLPTAVHTPLPVPSAGMVESFVRYRLPRHTETITAEKREPVNFILTADSDAEVTAAFHAAGWVPVLPASVAAVTRMVGSAVHGEHSPSAPLAPSFWDGKPNDLGFAQPLPLPEGTAGRTEARLWRTPLETGAGTTVYVGVVERTVGYEWGVIPRMTGDLDQTREELARGLIGSGHVSGHEKISLSPPAAGRTLTGSPFFSDGTAWVVHLAKQWSKLPQGFHSPGGYARISAVETIVISHGILAPALT